MITPMTLGGSDQEVPLPEEEGTRELPVLLQTKIGRVRCMGLLEWIRTRREMLLESMVSGMTHSHLNMARKRSVEETVAKGNNRVGLASFVAT